METEAHSGLWNLPQLATQLTSALKSEWWHCHFSALALGCLCYTSGSLVSYIIYWAVTVCLALLEMGALRADSDRSQIGRRKWHLGLSCQKWVISDTWPAQRHRAKTENLSAWGNRGGYLHHPFKVYSEPSCVGPWRRLPGRAQGREKAGLLPIAMEVFRVGFVPVAPGNIAKALLKGHTG